MKNDHYLILQLIVLIITAFLLFIGNDPLNIFADNINIIIFILFIVIIIIFFIIAFIQSTQKKKLLKSTLENTPGKKGVIVDFLIYKTAGHHGRHEPPYIYTGIRINSLRYYVFPIVKDLETQKTYVTILKHNHSKYKTKWQMHLNAPLDFHLLSSNQTMINIGDIVNMYIFEELGQFNIDFENNYLEFESVKYKYAGKNDESFLIKQNHSNTLINVVSYDFLNLLKDTIIFEGSIDVDDSPTQKTSY